MNRAILSGIIGFTGMAVRLLSKGIKRDGSFEAAVSFLLRNNHRARSSQKATALAAATFRESTPWAMGMRTV